MKIRTSRLCVQTSVWVLASALCVTGLTGCGANGNFTQGLGPDTAVVGLGGTVHGGPNPVSGAAVTLYATTTIASPSSGNNYGYGQPGTVLGTTSTDSTGHFTFTGDASKCTAGQQAYIVAAGGNTGSNSSNSAALLMAALGPCSGLTDTTAVIIDEPTTIAAAYALSGFMTVSGTTVDISAPAKNNAATAACTVVSNATTACTASGLAHAFLNAANLVNKTTGAVNSTVSTGSTIQAIVPQMLINSLANSVEACVNSNGDTTTPTAPCTILMTNTSTAAIAINPSLSAPTNTLQALLDLAQYPSEATGSTGTGAPVSNSATALVIPSAATTALFNVANSNAYYAPALTAAPLDFTIAIEYQFSPAGTAVAPWGLGTDINDNAYVYVTTTPPTIYSLASNGAQNWEAATAGANNGCGSAGTRCEPATDTLGNLWVVDHSGLTKMNASTGTLVGSEITNTGEWFSMTVDPGNNLWLAGSGLGTQTGASILEELPQGASAITEVQAGSPAAPITAETNLHDLVFDTAGNLWSASNNVGGTTKGAILLISSNNSLTAPAFATAGTSGNPVLLDGGFGSNSFGSVIDISGNAWFGSEDELNEVTSSGSEIGAQNYAQGMSIIYGSAASGGWQGGVERNLFIDGDSNIIVESTSGGQGYFSMYYPSAPYDGNGSAGNSGAVVYFNPCYVASGATTCALQTSGGESLIVDATRGTAVDASGAIWGSFASSPGFGVIQLLGPGSPTWGQSSFVPLIYGTNTGSGRPY